MNSNDTSSENTQQSSITHSRNGVNHGCERPDLVPAHDASASHTKEKNSEPGTDRTSIADSEDINAKILALIQENHLQFNLPLLLPDTRELQRLQETAPELYREYIHAIRTSTDTDSFERRARYELPAEYTKRGQRYGLSAVLAVLVLAGYAIYAGSSILAGVLGVVDLVALAAVFQNTTNKDSD